MFFILESEIESVDKSTDLSFCSHFSQSLAKTDTSATNKWYEAERVALFTFGSKCIRTFWVEALRNKLTWFNPLFWIVMQTVDEYTEIVSCSYFQIT